MKIIYTNLSPINNAYTNLNHIFYLAKHKPQKLYLCIWDNFVYKPALNELLPNYLNAEAQWAIETGKVKPDAKIPDFNEYIYREPLRKVKPEAVTI